MEKWPIDSYYSNALWKSIIKYFNFVLFKRKKSFRACLNAFCQIYSRKNGLNFDRLRFVKLAANYERYAYVVTRSCFHTLFISNRLCLYSDTFLSCLLAFSPNKSRQLRLLNYDNTKKRKNKQSENSKRMQATWYRKNIKSNIKSRHFRFVCTLTKSMFVCVKCGMHVPYWLL